MSDAAAGDDLVLEILLQLRSEQQALISEGLVREVYDLQRRFQFDTERDAVVLGLKRAVEAEVDNYEVDAP
jgi:hypothetical protein